MSEFVDSLPETFELFGPVTVRKMFGGYGLYHDGTMFAIVVDDTLYLKSDAESAADFERVGLGQFAYERNGRIIKMSFYLAPDEIIDDREQAARWARRAFAAALRALAAKKIPKRR